MAREGLLIGEIATRSGLSRKAIRLYEAAGIVPAARRTASRYRVYGPEVLGLLEFVGRARRLGFRLDEIREIVAIRRSGRTPCTHIRGLVESKIESLDETMNQLTELRKGLRGLLREWSRTSAASGVVCPHIEGQSLGKGRR